MLAARLSLCSSRGSVISLKKTLRHASAVKQTSAYISPDSRNSPISSTANTLPSLCVKPFSQHRYYASKANIQGPDHKPELQRVYTGSLTTRMKAVKVFSLTTSIVGLAAQPILMEQGMKLGGTPMAVFLCGFGGFFTFVTPLLLHFITKKYVTEIYYNPATGEYIATTISLLLYKIQIKFRASDVTVPEVPGMFTSFLVGKTPLFVDPFLFDDPDHYIRIMGYDKPLDLKMDLKQTEKLTSKQIEKMDLKQPEKLTSKQIEKMDLKQPEKLNLKQPEKLNSKQPEKLNLKQPEKLNLKQPEKLNSKQPEKLNLKQTEKIILKQTAKMEEEASDVKTKVKTAAGGQNQK